MLLKFRPTLNIHGKKIKKGVIQMSKVEINYENCKGCKYCVNCCPNEVLKIGEKSNSLGYRYAVVVNQENCIACKLCAVSCPDSAIEIYK